MANNVCEYCGRKMSAGRLKAHVRICLRSERVAEYVRKELEAMSPGGILVGQSEYERLCRSKPDMPSRYTLRAHFGSWDDVAEWAELLPSSQHEDLCWRQTREALVEMGYRLHGGECGPSHAEWNTFRDKCLLSSQKLLNRFGTWTDVLGWAAGMIEADSSYYTSTMEERSAITQVSGVSKQLERQVALAALEKEVAERERRGDGLPVSGDVKERGMYDWSRRRWRKRFVIQLR